MIEFTAIQNVSDNISTLTLIYVVLLAFVLSSILAFVYQKTFRGLSYSRNYVQSIVLISIISAVVIQSVGESLARGVGIMAAMAIIRFRTNFKDPRDTLFLFASLAAGIACGAYTFKIAVIGTLGFSLAAIILHYSPLGPTNYFDGMLRFNLDDNSERQSKLEAVLRQYCKNFALITLRDMGQGDRLDYAYHIKLKRNVTHEEFLQAIKLIDSVQGINFMLQEATVDI